MKGPVVVTGPPTLADASYGEIFDLRSWTFDDYGRGRDGCAPGYIPPPLRGEKTTTLIMPEATTFPVRMMMNPRNRLMGMRRNSWRDCVRSMGLWYGKLGGS